MRRSSHRPISRRLWIAFAAAALGVAGTIRLGVWQTDRADAKERTRAAMETAASASPIVADAVALRDPGTLVDRHVSLSGRWAADRVVYLDNRPRAGQAGFYVLMALQLDGPGGVDVVVNRGWLPRDGNDRTRIASYRTPSGPVVVTGIALRDEPRLLELGAAPHRLNGLWQNFDFAAFSGASGRDPVRLVVRQDRDASDDGLARDWPDRGTALQAQIDRHRGYAFQWFALAATLVVLVLVQVFRARSRLRIPAR